MYTVYHDALYTPFVTHAQTCPTPTYSTKYIFINAENIRKKILVLSL